MQMHNEMIEKRRLILSQSITPDIIEELISLIGALALRSSDDAELYINSSGGATEASLRLYDVIKASGIKFCGRVIGKCMSAAIIPLQACHERQSLPNATFMVHEPRQRFESWVSPSVSLDAQIVALREMHQSVRKIDKKSKKFITSRLNDDQNLFETYYKSGHDFDAEEALKMGLIDEIVESK